MKIVNQDSRNKTGETRAAEGKKVSGGEAKSRRDQGALIILPLRNSVLFSLTLAPLTVGRPASIQAVEEANRRAQPIGILLQRDSDTEVPGPGDLYSVGTVAEVLRVVSTGNDQHHVYVQGTRRFQSFDYVQTEPFLIANVLYPSEAVPQTEDFEARVIHLRQQVHRALALLPASLTDVSAMVDSLQDVSGLIDFVASWLDIPLAEKQKILETFDLESRLRTVSIKLTRQIEILELTRKISSEAKDALDRTQREYLLREQLKAIHKELGESDGKGAEIEELREKIAKAKMPAEVQRESLKELGRLERMIDGAPEHSIVRTRLEWLIELPWSVATEDRIDLARARAVLDADHHDLDKVKKRILEYLAVRKLNPQGKSPILCFVGPPGVGKTSLGQSIAAAMNRKFVRQSLGGVHDEAEIRGHRRTYIGALPGRIIQGIKRAGSNNPVFMLDEIDKLSASFHGDPSAALLEVLDPEQNTSFQDHYLDVPFDLSHVLFITTANVLDAIPGPLQDRMEVIELPGYAEEDKVSIASRYLVPRQLSAAGLANETLSFADDALSEVIRGYTREAGVRQLEREIGAICRAVAARVAAGSDEKVNVTARSLSSFLGPAKYFNEVALRTGLPGVATGLAWTPVGGDILFVEATKMIGDGKLLLTGHLGEVMKESAQAALSLAKSRAADLGLEANCFTNQDIHIHIPAGAIPKDGPSAGVTMFAALVSLFTSRRIRNDVAMTGEISLRGLVLPVGGIKEKVLAAKRAGIFRVLLPKLNQKDLEDIAPSVRDRMSFELVETVDDILFHALENGYPPPKAGKDPNPLGLVRQRAQGTA